MLKIRLMRIGAKKRPFYRVVVIEERSKRTGGYIEALGTYNPLTEPKDIKLKQDRIDYWTKQGAQPSVGYLRIIGKAPQRPPRKPKKEKKEEIPAETPAATEQPTTEEKPTKEQANTSEGPAQSADGSPVETPESQAEEKPAAESEPKNEGSA